MLRLSLPIIGCTLFALVLVKNIQADDTRAPKSENRTLVTSNTPAAEESHDTAVFKSQPACKPNCIKRLVTLPGEKIVVQGDRFHVVRNAFDTIRTKDADIEITTDAIRIKGGEVEIIRSNSH